MPYADPEKQKVAQRASYLRKKEQIARKARQERPRRTQYAKERRKDLKAWVDSLKDQPCADCGGRFHSCAMDYDHVREAKVAGINQLVRHLYSREVILAEIVKCDLVCATCHRLRHYSN